MQQEPINNPGSAPYPIKAVIRWQNCGEFKSQMVNQDALHGEEKRHDGVHAPRAEPGDALDQAAFSRAGRKTISGPLRWQWLPGNAIPARAHILAGSGRRLYGRLYGQGLRLRSSRTGKKTPARSSGWTYDWFADLPGRRPRQLADDGTAETAAPPASWPAAVAEASAEVSARRCSEIPPPSTPPPGARGPRAPTSPLRATIGDQLQRPGRRGARWDPVSGHADPAALGEADIRAARSPAVARRCLDAWLPRCQADQHRPGRHPVALWDKDNAITSSGLTIAVMRYRRASSRAGGWRYSR